MMTDLEREYLKTMARAMQVVVLALAAGVVTFGVIVTVIGAEPPGDRQPEPSIISYLAVAAACVALVASIAVPGLLAAIARRRIVTGQPAMPNPKLTLPAELGDVGPIAVVYQTRLIVSVAFLEGAAFFNLIAYLLEGQLMSLTAAAIMLIALVSRFPTASQMTGWVEEQLKAIEQLRQMQPQDAR